MAEPVTTDPHITVADHPRDVDVQEPFTELEGVRRPLAPLYGNEHKHALEERVEPPQHSTPELRLASPRCPRSLCGGGSRHWSGWTCSWRLIASGVGFVVRFGSGEISQSLQGVPYWLIAAFLVPIWVAVLAAGGAYDRRFLGVGAEEYRKVVNAGVWLLAVLVVAVFVLHGSLSRAYVAITFPLLIALTLLERYAVRQALHRHVMKGHAIYRTVIVGSPASAAALRKHMDRAPWAGFNVVGVHDPDAEHINVDELVDAVRQASGDTIAIAAAWEGGSAGGALRALSWRLEGTGIQLVVVPAVTDIAGPRIVVRPVQGLPLLMVEDPQMNGGRRLLKQILDRTVALTGLVILSPLLAVLAVLIKLTSRGPVLYKQERVGVHGDGFRIWKFRTMRVGADQELTDLAHLNHSDGLLFKIRKDPRVTPSGRWIRRHSLDELPQLWNVLRGQMSLVGPRPPLPCEVEQYGDDVRRRLLVKPGMSGLWQISGRAELPVGGIGAA